MVTFLAKKQRQEFPSKAKCQLYRPSWNNNNNNNNNEYLDRYVKRNKMQNRLVKASHR